MKKKIWLSYDLGIKGDYERLFSWLAEHGAQERGDSFAVLEYEYLKNLVGELRQDLRKNVDLAKRDRIYIVWLEGGKAKGRFLFGGQKAAPWAGYGTHAPAIDEEE